MTDSYTIVLDSTSDFPKELEEKYNIPLVLAKVIIGTKEYLDRVGISREKILDELINSEEKITTSQPSPKDFHDIFSKTLEESDHILYLGVSHKLSATYQNAMIAAKKFKGKITCIDTLSVSHGITLMAYHAILRKEQGMKLELLVEEIKEMIVNTRVYILVKELKYLYRGGRIGRARHFIGSSLKLKPLLHLVDGELDALKSVRGTKAGYRAMSDFVTKDAQEFGKFTLIGTYGNDNPKFKRLSNSVNKKLKPLKYLYVPIGPAVSCQVGPNAEAFFIAKIPEEAVDIYI